MKKLETEPAARASSSATIWQDNGGAAMLDGRRRQGAGPANWGLLFRPVECPTVAGIAVKRMEKQCFGDIIVSLGGLFDLKIIIIIIINK